MSTQWVGEESWARMRMGIYLMNTSILRAYENSAQQNHFCHHPQPIPSSSLNRNRSSPINPQMQQKKIRSKFRLNYKTIFINQLINLYHRTLNIQHTQLNYIQLIYLINELFVINKLTYRSQFSIYNTSQRVIRIIFYQIFPLQNMSRIAIFVLTFLTYGTVHMMRTTYSFNKHTFQKIFGINDLFLGFVDSFIYLTLALGTFLRYSIVNSSKPVQACLYTAIPTVIGFSVIPVISLFKQNQFEETGSVLNHILIAASFGVFGFFQLSFFPATLTIFSHHFNVKQDGKLVGMWSSKSNAGNIIGFLMANLFVYTFHIRWQYTMLLCSAILIIVCLCLWKLVPNPKFESQTKITTGIFMKFFLKTWSQTQFKLYIMSFSLFKAILYSYELWTPKFLSDNGFDEYSGYVPMLFDVFTLFGSFIMGMVYQSQSKKLQADSTIQLGFLSKYKFFIPAILVILICSCYIFIPGSLAVYFILGASMGLFLGAIYNSLQNNQIMNYTDNQPEQTDMFSTINIGIGCAMVGISQFIIGLVLNLGNKQDKGQDEFVQRGSIYIVIAGIGVLAAVLTFARSKYVKDEQQPLLKDSITKKRSGRESIIMTAD